MRLQTAADWLQRTMRPDPRPGSRVLVLWWGSIKRGEITAGDYMAAGNVVLGLQERGLPVEIAASRFPGSPSYTLAQRRPRATALSCSSVDRSGQTET